jgi:hypothetical protein
MISELLLGVLTLIEQMLPLIGTSGTSVTAIGNIVVQLNKWLPLIVQEVGVLYQPVKNIIAALSANPATLADQQATLAQIDAQVDTAFEAAAKDVDPDA